MSRTKYRWRTGFDIDIVPGGTGIVDRTGITPNGSAIVDGDESVLDHSVITNIFDAEFCNQPMLFRRARA